MVRWLSPDGAGWRVAGAGLYLSFSSSCTGVLAQIGGALHLNHGRGTHFAALYDIRTCKLPFASEAYGRVKAVAGWCGLQVMVFEMVPVQLHSSSS